MTAKKKKASSELHEQTLTACHVGCFERAKTCMSLKKVIGLTPSDRKSWPEDAEEEEDDRRRRFDQPGRLPEVGKKED